jgi:hypothetical protein
VTKQTTPTTNIWGDRLLTILTVFVGISFLAILVLGSYFDQPITQALSFDIKDGQCDPDTQGVGVHCFGDYQYVQRQLNPNLGAYYQQSPANTYTPTGLLPNLAAKTISDIFGSRTALFVFLLLLAIAISIPAIYFFLRPNRSERFGAIFAFSTVFSQPFISTLDRGSSVGFALPFILLFAIKITHSPSLLATFAIVGAAAIRPQFALLAIGLLAFGQIRHFLITVFVFLLMTAASFILWPGSSQTNIAIWFRNITSYSSGAKTDVADKYPVNLSMRSAVDHIDTLLNNTVSNWIQIHYVALSIAILIAIVGVLFACRSTNSKSEVIIVSMSLPCLIPETSFVYYSLFTVVLGTLIFTNLSFLERTETEILGTTSKSKHFYQWFVISAIAICLAPFPFVFEVGRNSIALEYFGLIWSVILFWTLARSIMHNRQTSASFSNSSLK